MGTKDSILNFVVFVLAVIFLLPTCESSPSQSDLSSQDGISAESSLFWTGDGGRGESIAILNMSGEGLNADEQRIPLIVREVLADAFHKYSAMDVTDMVVLEQVIREGESNFYVEDNDIIRMGEVIPTKYQLHGTIRKTTAGFNVQIKIAEAANARTRATFTDNFQITQIDDLSGIRRASSDILAQMGIRLTAVGQEALMGPASANEIQAHNALARGITAQRQGTEIAAHLLFSQAAVYDPSLLEAAGRFSILHANISSGNIGMDFRNDIEWRRQWVARLTETEQFFHNFFRTESMPHTFFYISDIREREQDRNFQRETTSLIINGTYFHAHGIWMNPIEQTLRAVYDGLQATGRAREWGLANWPSQSITNLNAFARRNNNFDVVFEVLNNQNGVIGRTTVNLQGSWQLNSGRPSFSINTNYGYTVNHDGSLRWTVITFQNVNANDIHYPLTIRTVSINGVTAETAARTGNLQIQAIALDEYRRNARFQYYRGELRGFASQGSRTADLVIPETIWGDLVASIKADAFKNNRLATVNISNSVTSIGERAFSSNQLRNVIIPNSVTTIRESTFSDNQLRQVIIGNSVTSIGKEAFFKPLNNESRITNIIIGANVLIAEDAFGYEYTKTYLDGPPRTEVNRGGFPVFYDQNGKKAGTYVYSFTTSPFRMIFGVLHDWKYSP